MRAEQPLPVMRAEQRTSGEEGGAAHFSEERGGFFDTHGARGGVVSLAGWLATPCAVASPESA